MNVEKLSIPCLRNTTCSMTDSWEEKMWESGIGREIREKHMVCERNARLESLAEADVSFCTLNAWKSYSHVIKIAANTIKITQLLLSTCLLLCFKQKNSLFNTKKLVNITRYYVQLCMGYINIWKVQVQKIEYLSQGWVGVWVATEADRGVPPKRVPSQQHETCRKGSDVRQPPVE